MKVKATKTTQATADQRTEIDKTIQEHADVFKRPGVMSVRPGYKIKNGWITQRHAVVVTVGKKKARVAAKDAIPKTVGNYPTDVREATTWQNMRKADPQKYATLQALHRTEYRQPEFPLERDAQTGKLLAPAKPAAAASKQLKKPTVPYTPAPGASLAPVTDTMSMTLCASPDAGWMELKGFLQDISSQFTVGMYDFTSAHVLATVKSALKGKQDLSLVLDHPALNHTADQSDEQTQAALAQLLGKREEFAWAAESRDPMVSKGIFPNAYHIKVAVKDGATFWLSSGNWNNSNQPDIDSLDPKGARFAKGGATPQVERLALKSDRDWHAIVEHAGLAKTFAAFLSHDLTEAAKVQAPKAAAQATKAAIPKAATAPSPEKPIRGTKIFKQFFKPFEIKNEKVTVQPVLTPDQGAGNYVANFLKLIKSATKKLYIQTQYIHPPNAGAYPGLQSLIEALKDRIAKDVDVRIILSEYEATGQWLEKLQQAGIDASKLVRIQNGVHNKGFLVDTKVFAVGSQNWSGDGVQLNRDASMIITHAAAAGYFEGIFLHDWTNLAAPKLVNEVSSATAPKAVRAARKPAAAK